MGRKNCGFMDGSEIKILIIGFSERWVVVVLGCLLLFVV